MPLCIGGQRSTVCGGPGRSRPTPECEGGRSGALGAGSCRFFLPDEESREAEAKCDARRAAGSFTGAAGMHRAPQPNHRCRASSRLPCGDDDAAERALPGPMPGFAGGGRTWRDARRPSGSGVNRLSLFRQAPSLEDFSLRPTEYRGLVLGLLLVAVVPTCPGGLAGTASRLASRWSRSARA